MNVLVLNAGSSSLKFELVETDQDRIANDTDRRIAGGVIERIGGQALLTMERADEPTQRTALPVRDHRAAIEMVLNKQSGLLGISGLTNDMRELLAEEAEHDDRRAHLAIHIFCYRVRKYIGAYLAAMGGADAVVFTGGIGENAAEVRRRIADGLQWLGLELDDVANQSAFGGLEARITTDESRLQAWVIPTDEELLIALDTARLVLGIEPRY